jgi:hypothetical protein
LSKWLIRKKSGKSILGPYTAIEVIEKLKEGNITLEDYVCEEGFATWTTIDKRKDITKFQGVDTEAERKKTLEQMDQDATSDEIILNEEVSEIKAAPDHNSRTWIRWLGLGVVSIVAIILIRMQTSTPINGGLSPPPIAKKPEVQIQDDKLRTRRSQQPINNQYNPNEVQGVSRYTTFDPSTVQEQTGGSLSESAAFENEAEPRRRMPEDEEPTKVEPTSDVVNEDSLEEDIRDVEPDQVIEDEGYEEFNDELPPDVLEEDIPPLEGEL